MRAPQVRRVVGAPRPARARVAARGVPNRRRV